MPSQELYQAQSECSTAQYTAPHEPSHICSPITEGSPAGTTSSSAPHAYPTGTFSPEFLAALWRLRLELAIFKLERRALPILNVFHNRRHHSGHTVWPMRRVPKQTQGISEANATSSSTQLLQARTTQPPKHNPWVPVALRHTPHHSLLYHEAHKTWLKWRGPLPMMKRLRRRSVRGSAVFAHRYKHGGRLVTCFWVRQRVELHVVRWSKLGSVALPSQRMVTERAGARGDWIRT